MHDGAIPQSAGGRIISETLINIGPSRINTEHWKIVSHFTNVEVDTIKYGSHDTITLKEQGLDLQVFLSAAMFVKPGQEMLLLALRQIIESVKVRSVATNLKEKRDRLDSELPNRYNESFLLPGRHQWRQTMR
jgi:hypothetical protein